MKRPLEMAHDFLAEVVTKEDIVVDATMGNGHDTLFLAKLAKQVYAFDIQEQAVTTTKERLLAKGLLPQVELIHQGHETVADYVPDAVHAAIFNLGYLPKSDKKIITLPETTEQALQALIQRIVPCGRIILVCYYGHEGGPEELEAVHRFCRQLPQAQFNVLSYQFINQRNQPPVLFCIERKKTSENR